MKLVLNHGEAPAVSDQGSMASGDGLEPPPNEASRLTALPLSYPDVKRSITT